MLSNLLSFGVLAGLSSLIVANPLPLVTRDDNDNSVPYPPNCLTDFMIAPMYIGGSTNDNVENICLTQWSKGLLVTGIQVWTEKNDVQGLQLTYSDGSTSDVVGEMNGVASPGNWAMNDKVTSAMLWGNGVGKFLGKIEIQTASGAKVDVGNDRTTGGFGFDTGGGLLLGMVVTKDNNTQKIVRAGPLFLTDEIQSVTATDFQYDDNNLTVLNEEQRGMTLQVLDSGYFTNNRTDGNTTYNFINQMEVDSTTTITLTNQEQIGFGVTVALETDMLVEKETTTFSLEYQYTNIKTTTTTTTNIHVMRWEVDNTNIAPGETIFCEATAVSGNYTGGFNSTTVITLNSGEQFSFLTRGSTGLVAWGASNATCSNVDHVPAGANLLALPSS